MDNVEKRIAEIEARLNAATLGPLELCLLASHAQDDIPWLIANLRQSLRIAEAYRSAYCLLVTMIGPCSCDPIWTNRGLHGPHCMWNNTCVADIDDDLTKALAAIKQDDENKESK